MHYKSLLCTCTPFACPTPALLTASYKPEASMARSCLGQPGGSSTPASRRPYWPRKCGPRIPRSLSRAAGAKQDSSGSVIVLEVEVGTANGSGQLRLLPRELEPRGELRGDVHPFRELEPDRPLLGVVDGVHHVDRQTALVEDVGDSDVLDLEVCGLERARRDDD